jgi:hypothetical protein
MFMVMLSWTFSVPSHALLGFWCSWSCFPGLLVFLVMLFWAFGVLGHVFLGSIGVLDHCSLMGSVGVLGCCFPGFLVFVFMLSSTLLVFLVIAFLGS